MRELEGKSAIITGGVVLNWSTGRSGYWADRVTVCGEAESVSPLNPDPPTSALMTVVSPEVDCSITARLTSTPVSSRSDHPRIACRTP